MGSSRKSALARSLRPRTSPVTFAGKPVPVGTISFEPDSSQGNRGPGSVAQIKDGKYSTGGKGPTGGPHIVRITGSDGVPSTIDGRPDGMFLPEGKALFAPYETKVDLPKGATTKDFEVPGGNP